MPVTAPPPRTDAGRTDAGPTADTPTADTPTADTPTADTPTADTAADDRAAAVVADDDPQYHALDAADLRLGATLRTPVVDGRGVLLLGAGKVVTETFHERLRSRGLGSVRVHLTELPRLLAGRPQGTGRTVPDERPGVASDVSNAVTDTLDALAARGRGLGLPPQDAPFAAELVDRGTEPHDAARERALVARTTAAVEAVSDAQRELATTGRLDVGGLNTLGGETLDALADDAGLFTAVGVNPHGQGYPFRHSVHTAMLAAGIGTTLGLDRDTLGELILGCLIHDAGMLLLDRDLFDHPGPLSREAAVEVAAHPVRLFAKLERVRELPGRAAFVAYQMHERCDGGGYPRRRRGAGLHVLAKIAAVADVYTALVSPRPHRPGLRPYFAVERLLYDAAAGRLDPLAVRALLTTVSLVPLGTPVELTDGRHARVLRTSTTFHRPVVEVTAATNDAPAEIIDLSAVEGLRVKGMASCV